MDNVSTIYRGDPILIIVTNDVVVGEEINKEKRQLNWSRSICQRPTAYSSV